jgi:hypothetical protein
MSGLLRAVELAGGVHPSVRHVRCSVEGDAFCEWELQWEPPSPPRIDRFRDVFTLAEEERVQLW